MWVSRKIKYLRKLTHKTYSGICQTEIKIMFFFPYLIIHWQNKLAKAMKMRKPPGTLGLKKFGSGKLWIKKVWAPNIFFNVLTFFTIFSHFLTIFNNFWPCLTIFYHFWQLLPYSKLLTIFEHLFTMFGKNWKLTKQLKKKLIFLKHLLTIFAIFLPFWTLFFTIFEHFWQFLNMLTILEHFWPYLNILAIIDHFWQFFTILPFLPNPTKDPNLTNDTGSAFFNFLCITNLRTDWHG